MLGRLLTRFPGLFTTARNLIVSLISLVLILVVLELVSLAYYHVRHGGFYYDRGQQLDDALSPDVHADNVTNVFHPLFGFIRPPSMPVTRITSRERLDRMVGAGVFPEWLSIKANNFGFFAHDDYPYRSKDDDEYLVAVFGGSVAQWFALQGEDRLIERLKDNPTTRNREIRILSFSQGAFKQPQQLNILTYFLARGQRFDFVLNIDGFNEVCLSYVNAINGIEPSMPSSQQLLPIAAVLAGTSVSSDYLECLLTTQERRRRLEKIDQLMRRNRSALVHVLLEHIERFLQRRFWDSAETLEALSAVAERTPLIHINETQTAERLHGNRDDFDDIADVWMRSSMMMDGFLDQIGVPYLHVVQPNQYFSRKVLSPQEKQNAIDPRSPFGPPAAKGYPYLLERLPLLEEAGVKTVSAVGAFDEIAETVYVDSCCHFNQLGNEIVAEIIAREMTEVIENQAATLRHRMD